MNNCWQTIPSERTGKTIPSERTGKTIPSERTAKTIPSERTAQDHRFCDSVQTVPAVLDGRADNSGPAAAPDSSAARGDKLPCSANT